VLAVSEAKFLAPVVDQVVLLARWRRTSRDLVRSAWTNLGQVNAPVVGIALTDVNLAAAAKDGYGYGYGGKYYKSYSSYHAG
jgi:polysaccharide biosynthesis transport protein